MQDSYGLDQRVDQLRGELIEHLSALCAIPSVKADPLPGMPFGEEVYRCLEKALSIAQNMGLTILNVDGYAGHADYGDQSEILGILGHLDVVPVGPGWDSDPFTPTLHDGLLTARGSSDNKGGTVAAMIALKAVIEAKVPLKKRIRIIYGCDEESGWACMNHYFSKIKAPDMGFVPDASFPVINTEKGIVQVKLWAGIDPPHGNLVRLNSGSRVNVVPDTAEAEFVSLPDDIDARIESFMREHAEAKLQRTGGNTIKSLGVSAHGSTPSHGVNAAALMVRFMLDADLLGDGALHLIKTLDQKIGLTTDGSLIGVNFEDEFSSPLTMNLGLLTIDSQDFDARLDIRYPISFTQDQIIDAMNASLSGSGIQAVAVGGHMPLHVPADSTLVSSLLKVYEQVTGEEGYTISMGGGTYARSMPNAVAFGSSFPEGRSFGAHEINESACIDELMKAAKIYAHAIVALCG